MCEGEYITLTQRVSFNTYYSFVNGIPLFFIIHSAKLSSPPVVVVNEKHETDLPFEVDIVSPLRNFHLQRPAKKHSWSKTKQKCKKSRELNLSVAAGSIHRPVVWPARLRPESHNAISKHVLHPARLSSVSSLTKCSKKDSSIEAAFSKKIVNMLRKNTALDLDCNPSVQQLPKNDKGAQRVFGISDPVLLPGKETVSFLSLSACPSKKEKDGTHPDVETYNFSNGSHNFRSPSSQAYKPSNSTALPPGSQDKDFCSSNSTPAPTSHQTSSMLGEESRIPHSCSHEMRLEETNVNELASYFDDLLHIPRKMSSMAEMMYA